MNKTVYILGAGFSKEAQAPSQEEFLPLRVSYNLRLHRRISTLSFSDQRVTRQSTLKLFKTANYFFMVSRKLKPAKPGLIPVSTRVLQSKEVISAVETLKMSAPPSSMDILPSLSMFQVPAEFSGGSQATPASW